MPIFILLGAAGVAASYLIPLIITCVVAGVTIVVTFVATRAFYKSEHKNDVEIHNLKKQQMERDHAMREEASRLANEAGIDMQILLKLSKEQQAELKSTIQEFIKNIDDSEAATKNLTTIANTIQEATNNANLQNADLNQELEKIKTELTTVYNKLSNTEKILANKEAELKQTINKLNELGNKIISNEVLEQLDKFQNLQQEYNHIATESSLSQDNEIVSLRSKNIILSETIETLNKTILKLRERLHGNSENEKQQIQEIQKLINDNKLLTETIESLTESVEVQNKTATKFATNHPSQLKLFK